MSVYEEIISARDQALSSIENVTDLSNLVDLEPALFGKKSALGSLKGLMGKLDPVSYTHLTLPTNREV